NLSGAGRESAGQTRRARITVTGPGCHRRPHSDRAPGAEFRARWQTVQPCEGNSVPMTDPVLLTSDRGAIRVLTVNRPDKLNALNGATLDALDDAFRAADADPAVRVVVLTGAGPKAFVAGADIAEMNSLAPVEGRDFSLRGQRM